MNQNEKTCENCNHNVIKNDRIDNDACWGCLDNSMWQPIPPATPKTEQGNVSRDENGDLIKTEFCLTKAKAEPEVCVCPFCNETDFDLVGLKIHLMYNCEEYEKINLPQSVSDDVKSE